LKYAIFLVGNRGKIGLLCGEFRMEGRVVFDKVATDVKTGMTGHGIYKFWRN
jgi:hypothetical protein